MASTAHSVAEGWAIAGWLITGLGWVYYWPTTIVIVGKAAAPQLMSTSIGGAFLSPLLTQVLAGWVGSHFDRNTLSKFWTIDAMIGAAGAMLILLLRKALQSGLEAGATDSSIDYRRTTTHPQAAGMAEA